MTTKNDKTLAYCAIHALAVCSASRGNTLAAASNVALNALERLGSSADYRDADEADVIAVCNAINDGHIRCVDACWGKKDEPLLMRLAACALAECNG